MVIPCVALIAIVLYMKKSAILKATKHTRFVFKYFVFPEKKYFTPPPLLRISIFFLSWPSWISSRIYRDPPGIFYFFALAPWKSMFFPQFLVYPPGIPTFRVIPPWNFPLISSKSPMCFGYVSIHLVTPLLILRAVW